MSNNIKINMENNIKEDATMENGTSKNNMEAEVMATINAESKKEAGTMRNSANNKKVTATMGNSNMQMAAMMPEDELAVVGGLELFTPNIPDFKSLVLPDEAADELVGKENSIARYRELNFFSPVRGMVNISNRLDGKIYARINEEEKGRRKIEYIQKYADNSYSPIMSLSQASMRLAAKEDFTSENIRERRIRNKIAGFLLEANEEYYGKFRGVLADELEVTDILNVLYEALPHLPVNSDSVTELPEETFYQLVDTQINNLSSATVFEHKSYYSFGEEEFEALANSMGMKKLELLKKLKQYGFLYLTPSSKGYQTNVRVKTGAGEKSTYWRYCIYKLSYFADIKDITDDGFDPNNF